MDAFDAKTGYGIPSASAAEQVTSFLRAVYGWMCVGLGVTAVVAFTVVGSPQIMRALVANRLLFFALLGGELALVFYLSARVAKLAPGTATALFLAYAGLNGVTLSMILLVYTGASIANTFGVCAVMFGALALYGTTTSRSLAGIGQFMFMGLIGLIGASIIGIFWHNTALQFLITCVGVLVFTGLTAYDAQRLKAMAVALPEGQSQSYAVVGALSLYLDFINLFLMLLRLFGNERD